jgi:hypothetical protein
MKYLQTIGIHRMFLNVATFSVTNRSICSTKKKIDFFNIFTWLLFRFAVVSTEQILFLNHQGLLDLKQSKIYLKLVSSQAGLNPQI